MTEGQSFLLLLAILYFEEASYWLPYGTILARTAGSGNARAAKGWANGRGVLAWLPFFAAGRRSPVAFWPFSVSCEGISSTVVPSPNPGWAVASTDVILRWDEAKSIVADGKKILINRQLFAKCVSGVAARDLTEFLRSIRETAEPKRDALISQIVELAVDPGFAEAALDSVLRESRICRALSSAVFPTLFFVIPAAYIFLGSGGVIYSLIGFLWALMIAVAVSFFRAHSRLTPELSGERWQHLIIALVSAPHAARLPDVLSRNALGMAWPLSVAEVGSASGDALRRDLLHPVVRDRDLIAEAFYQKWLSPLGRPGKLPDSGFGCPRCLGCFTREGTCPDCGGLLLVEAIR